MAETTGGEVGRPRDLLRGFAGSSGSNESLPLADEDSGEIELSLGLSLGGCFGVDTKGEKLHRSSSVASISFLARGEEDSVEATAHRQLMRTSSLPVEAEEEQRKRRCMQSLRRLEVKRKRMEKRNFRLGSRDRTVEVENYHEGMENREGKVAIEMGKSQFGMLNGVASIQQQQLQPHRCATASGGLSAISAAEGTFLCSGPISQGSVGSQGSCSAGGPDFEHQQMQEFEITGLGSNADNKSPSSNQRQLNHKANQTAAIFPAVSMEGKLGNCTGEDMVTDASKKAVGRGNGLKGIERTMMEQMPCVFTKELGPNGRRIEGFLYNYRMGEEVRIVCVCHGSFLSPAEFVKHAGGGDVAYPLRHIVVNPSASTIL